MAVLVKSRMSGDCKAIIINLEGSQPGESYSVRATHVPTGTIYKGVVGLADDSYAMNNIDLGGLYFIEVLNSSSNVESFQYLVSTCSVDKCLVLLTDKLLSCGCTSPACSAILNKAQKVMLLIKSAQATAARIMREEDKILVSDADSQYRKAVEMCDGHCDCGC
tara:strand:- start:318 stop:809 length:492 start_codon:yes stop_codon:yes gene_type:complete